MISKEDNKKLEIKQKKEYIRFLTNQLFKLKSNQRNLTRKLEQTEKEIQNLAKEKVQTEKWLTKNSYFFSDCDFLTNLLKKNTLIF